MNCFLFHLKVHFIAFQQKDKLTGQLVSFKLVSKNSSVRYIVKHVHFENLELGGVQTEVQTDRNEADLHISLDPLIALSRFNERATSK